MKLNDRKGIIKSTLTRPQVLKRGPRIYEQTIKKCTKPTVRKGKILA